MKHSLKIVIILVMLFLAAQYIGLFIVGQYHHISTTVVEGEVITEQSWENLPYDIERPDFKEETSVVPFIGLIIFATLLILLIMKLGAAWLWKLWFFISIMFCLVIAFAPFFTQLIAFLFALILTGLKMWHRHPLSHNISELFLYGGLAAVFVPVLNVLNAFLLLLAISVYDFIAVWKTKHMVSMAKFQTKMKMFAGILIPYGKDKMAILGGGDIGIPLLFTAVVLKTQGLSALVIPLFTALALLYLMLYGEKNKFYPAMPYLTVGCIIGYGVSLLI